MQYRTRLFGSNALLHNIKLLLIVVVIWAPFATAVWLDIWIEIYHRIAFKLYGRPYVKRSDYIIFDRQKLSYLTLAQRINCTYCAYMNGFFRYASQIAQETELVWCGIKHKAYPSGQPEAHEVYAAYNNPQDLNQKFPAEISKTE